MAEQEFSISVVGVDWLCDCGGVVAYSETETYGSHLHICGQCYATLSLPQIYPTTRMRKVGTLQ